ncbi:MAG TPA: hypothetical protein VN618_13470 [Solirubrobacteraceae bacterium]|nr:hypothetical protein [Solirubrobacteraceae bacterium]
MGLLTALVHLVWGPLGLDPLRGFLRSYREHDAGAEHELIVLLNGLGLPGSPTREEILAELDGVAHRPIETEAPVQDLAAYVHAAERLADHETLCFVNSYATVLADGWLGLFIRALSEPGVGLVGATGNWESLAEWRRGLPWFWPVQLLSLPEARRDYPRFPNPHIRTSSFAIGRELLLSLDLPEVPDKPSAYRLESGIHGFTRQVQARGLRAVVVGRDGRSYEPPEWPASRTFRSGREENLLVADNQTSVYLTVAPWLRRRLRHDSWGREGVE